MLPDLSCYLENCGMQRPLVRGSASACGHLCRLPLTGLASNEFSPQRCSSSSPLANLAPQMIAALIAVCTSQQWLAASSIIDNHRAHYCQSDSQKRRVTR